MGEESLFQARSKHIRVNSEEQCMCTFQILWQDGSHVGQMDKVQCENIYLLQFGSIASHPVLKKTSFFLNRKHIENLQI